MRPSADDHWDEAWSRQFGLDIDDASSSGILLPKMILKLNLKNDRILKLMMTRTAKIMMMTIMITAQPCCSQLSRLRTHSFTFTRREQSQSQGQVCQDDVQMIWWWWFKMMSRWSDDDDVKMIWWWCPDDVFKMMSRWSDDDDDQMIRWKICAKMRMLPPAGWFWQCYLLARVSKATAIKYARAADLEDVKIGDQDDWAFLPKWRNITLLTILRRHF